jgi:3-hydroxybutyryl-CoA dehydrogenase
MKIAVITDDALKEELLATGMQDKMDVQWLAEPAMVNDAKAYLDLMFQPTAERINMLKKLQPVAIIVNSVITTLDKLPADFIRFNGWPSFLKRPLAESSCSREDLKPVAEKIFTQFNKSIEWVPDVAGFISARIISMIINEAYFAFDEQVSSKQEIDVAMKLGTNYPYGPFEWAEKIGLQKINELLTELALQNSRYEPAALLKKEASLL